MQLPRYADNLAVGKFKKFLINCGGQILHETNEYEVIRCQTDKGVQILYRKQSGLLTWPDELVKAWMAYKSGGKIKWRAMRKRKVNRKRGQPLVETLRHRDGDVCWFCGGEFGTTDKLRETIEHLLNISNGGNNHINNLVLAHNVCNQKARNMSIAEKVLLREKLTEERLLMELM